MVLPWLIVVHRWVGVALCVVFLLWFPSGIGMMYWTFPTVSARDRLERGPALDPETVVLSPAEAAARIGISATPGQVRLNTFDGRPVYRFGGGRGAGRIVYADTGEEQTAVSGFMRDRLAAAWTGQPVREAQVRRVTEVDQWTVQGQLRNAGLLWKYSWPNGEQLYLAPDGEVVQYTTTASRLGAYVGAIPHWLYFTPLRKHQPVWINVVIWAAAIGTIGALIGLIIGLWRYSPSKRYRAGGVPARLPYHGQKRWHTVLGLVFGVGAATWAFSGMLSLDPFPRSEPAQAGARRTGPGLAAALRGRVEMTDFDGAHPRDVLATHPDLPIKELELTSFAGEPMYAANLDRGRTQMIALDGTAVAGFELPRILDIVKAVAPDPEEVEARVVHQYDLYYLDRTRQRPLPVILALMNDAEKSRYYIDPATARVVGSYSSRSWVRRWLYNGLHSLDFPWLYNYRPLWDIVVITFMVGGTALCVTSLVLAWRVLGGKLARLVARRSRDAMVATR